MKNILDIIRGIIAGLLLVIIPSATLLAATVDDLAKKRVG